MRNLNDIMNEREQKIKEYKDKIKRNENIEQQWKDIEFNIDDYEISEDTKRLLLCYGEIYEENKNKLVNDYNFNVNNFNKEIDFYDTITKRKAYCTYYYLDGIDDNTTVTEELNKNYLNNQQEDKLNKNSRNNIKTIINSLNNESDSKYNLNDGQHNNRKDVFGKRINKENKINIDNVDKLSEENYNKIKYYSKEGDNIKEKYTKNYTVLNLNDGKGKLETYKDGRKISEQEINLKDDLSSYIKSKDFINKYIKLVNEIENEML